MKGRDEVLQRLFSLGIPPFAFDADESDKDVSCNSQSMRCEMEKPRVRSRGWRISRSRCLLAVVAGHERRSIVEGPLIRLTVESGERSRRPP